jgi:hypothetical protein
MSLCLTVISVAKANLRMLLHRLYSGSLISAKICSYSSSDWEIIFIAPTLVRDDQDDDYALTCTLHNLPALSVQHSAIMLRVISVQ